MALDSDSRLIAAGTITQPVQNLRRSLAMRPLLTLKLQPPQGSVSASGFFLAEADRSIAIHGLQYTSASPVSSTIQGLDCRFVGIANG